MSSPPNRIVPAVGVSCSRISFDVVVLPHPDSPISPSVSPGQIAKSTPSTAFTQPIWRRSSIPVLTGKYFWRFSSSSNGAGIFFLWLLIQQPALRRPVRANPLIVRVSGHALGHAMGASRVEGAARRRLGEVGGVPRDRVERLLAAELWHRAEQGLGVGVLRRPEQIADRTVLDDLAGVHHRHFVAHLGDDAEIVGDENQRDAAFLLDVLQDLEVLGLDGDVEIGRRLVGDDQLWFPRHGDRADDPLAHAAAHLMRVLAHAHLRRGNAHRPQQVSHSLPQRAPTRALMMIGWFSDLPVDAEERIQRGHRVLQDHGNLSTTDATHLARLFCRQLLPGKFDAAADNARCRGKQTDDRQAGRGLAASRLADEPDRLAFAKRKADPVDRFDHAGPAKREVMRLQVGYPQQRAHRGAYILRSCGSRRTLSQSPSSCVASTTSRMPSPGKMVSHQSPTISIDRPSASIDPQAGSGGGTPTPRKLSEASAMITTPIVRLASTIVEFSTLGNMWRKITRVREPPAISASLTNSRSRRLSTSPRMTRA